MAEPPAKRARRMDSSTMWDMNDRHSKQTTYAADEVDGSGRRDRDETKRPTTSSRAEGRRRSRSRERDDKRRDRSRSRDRWARDGYRDGRRDGDRDMRSVRDRDRSRSRDRSRDKEYSRRDYYSKSSRYRDRPRTRSRSRSRSPARNGAKLRTRSPPRGPRSDRKDTGRRSVPPDADREPNGLSDRKRQSSRLGDAVRMDLDDAADADDMEQLMMKTMGFKSFRSTQNTKVPGNQIYGVRKEKKTEYRQYMNRVGGFNRPLSPSR
ncbi:U4/U6.U5 tri-snRNP-associated protein 3 [Coccidioides immitis RS]|uniref:U4/U6.U5 tri-snRNP-associated protein 3 n=3 Tax=Coccidioides immitis TaxID=5501 RepID=A0A0E1S019_COCIM|nr:U4/U6.U5 tri-snRNP-associated protein 3 [Coccidioides immitis RS]EAS27590.2 U4/U6.U5 tri-snRNP-associated protein 3 [Coccidioides immitis RS]KMU76921.1 hypothetical protein CISG_05962 [Coccidioides immitis RMSCC 3703]KMU90870.1 hypothetical protein CIHG_08525 [Coccidioides immitis H538.4]TPX20349.1 hypothetical protein DIZ76_016237 [Coccidioides immitis]